MRELTTSAVCRTPLIRKMTAHSRILFLPVIGQPFCKEKALKLLILYCLFKHVRKTNFDQFRLELNVMFKNFIYGLVDLS